MLPVVDLVVPDDGAAVGADLDACQRVAVDVVALYEAPAVAEDVDSTLVPVEDGVAPAGRWESARQGERTSGRAHVRESARRTGTLSDTEVEEVVLKKRAFTLPQQSFVGLIVIAN